MVSTTKMRGEGCLVPSFRAPQPLYDTVAGSNLRGDQFDPYRAELQAFQEKLNIKYFGHKNWYDWCISEWGTKWDIGRDSAYGDEAEIENGECLKIFFDSAWSPPIKAYEKLEELGFHHHRLLLRTRLRLLWGMGERTGL
jgi:hypothetical protein